MGKFGKWRAAGMKYLRSNQWDKSIEAFQKALEYKPNSIDLLLWLGEACLRAGKHNEAKRVYKRALKIDEKDIKVAHRLASVYNLIGNADKAIKVCKKALELDIRVVSARGDDIRQYIAYLWNSLGLYYHNDKANKKSHGVNGLDEEEYKHRELDAYVHAYELNPRNISVWYNLGNFNLNKSRFVSSSNGGEFIRGLFQKEGVEQEPNYKNAYFNLARYYYKRGEIVKALNTCKKCIDIDSKFKDALDLYVKLKQNDH